MDLLDISKDITFDEPTHVYKDKNGKILTSVTTCLHSYVKEFDPSGIVALMCGRRKGISKETMQAEWKAENKRSCDYGHDLHSQVEYYLKTGEIKDTPQKEIVEDFAKIKFKGKIHSELRLKSDFYGLAGTCDLGVLDKNTVKIHDLKTNKRFDLKPKYSNKFLYPLEYLPECHITTYSLQILAYGMMVKEHGFDFEPGQILWVNPIDKKIQKFEVLDLNKELDILLNHFKGMNEW